MTDPVDIAEGRRLLADYEAGLTVQVAILNWSLNNLPALLDELETLRRDNERLRALCGDAEDRRRARAAHTAEVEELRAERERLAAEVEAFRTAMRNGIGPSCEDVCLRSCIGVCDPNREDDDG